MTHSDLFRVLLDEQDIPYKHLDFKARKITYIECSINGEPFDIEFNEPLDGIPGTLGAMRELSFTATSNITAEEALKVIMEVMDR